MCFNESLVKNNNSCYNNGKISSQQIRIFFLEFLKMIHMKRQLHKKPRPILREKKIRKCISYLKLFLVIYAGNIIYNSQQEIFPLECYHTAR